MQINVEAEQVKLWVNEHKRPDGSTWRTFAISTSSKNEAGEYVNKSLKVKMTRDVVLPEDLKNGETVTIRGSLSNETFMDKEGNRRVEHMLWAREIDFDNRVAPRKGEKADSFEALDEDLPF